MHGVWSGELGLRLSRRVVRQSSMQLGCYVKEATWSCRYPSLSLCACCSRKSIDAKKQVTSHYLMLEEPDLLRSHEARGLDSWR
jgi:hypothetical protein